MSFKRLNVGKSSSTAPIAARCCGKRASHSKCQAGDAIDIDSENGGRLPFLGGGAQGQALFAPAQKAIKQGNQNGRCHHDE